MNKVLLSCPSRGRPDLLRRMVDSFYETVSFGTKLVIYLDDDDPRLSEYAILNNEIIQTIVGKRMNVAQIHNLIATWNMDYEYYMPINDDIIFRTKSWDIILSETIKIKGDDWGISYGDDLTNNNAFNLPTFGMLSGNIVRTLGHVYPLELKALFGDTYLLDIGRAIGKLFYCSDVIIEHKQPGFYIKEDVRISEEFDKLERDAYAKYIDNNLDNDVKKLFNAIVESNM